jgi:glycosyltransferase EpsD
LTKLLHITRTGRTVNTFLLPHIRYWLENGMQVELAHGSENEDVDSLDVPKHKYHIERSLSPLSTWRSVRELAAIIRAGGYDIVLVHMPHPGIIARLAWKLAGKPGKLVYFSHGLPCYPRRFWPAKLLFLGVERFLSRWTDAIIVLNEYDRRLAEKYRLGRRVFKMNSMGIDCDAIRKRVGEVDRTQYRKKLGVPVDKPLVCYPGRFIKAKGVDIFVQMIDLCQKGELGAHYVIAGEGPLEGYVRKFMENRGLGACITMLGWYNDVVGLLAASDVLCFPTRYEGSPVLVQEAMTVGVPVITSDVPGPQDLIEDGKTGYICEPGADAFAARLMAVLRENDTAAGAELVKNAQAAAAKYGVKQCCETFYGILQKIST